MWDLNPLPQRWQRYVQPITPMARIAGRAGKSFSGLHSATGTQERPRQAYCFGVYKLVQRQGLAPCHPPYQSGASNCSTAA